MSRTWLRLSLVVFATTTVPALAWAHSELLWPPPRTGSDCRSGDDLACKTGPCGNGVGTPGTATILTQGSSITMQWQETIEHPGHYEMRLSTNDGEVLGDGSNRFTWVLNSNLADLTGAIPAQGPYRQYTYTMTVPTSQTCAPCTLQFLQFMMNNGQYYYSCAEVHILAEGAPTPTPSATVTPTPTPGGNPGDPDTVHGGCVCDTTAASSARGWFVMAGLALAGLLFVRRAIR